MAKTTFTVLSKVQDVEFDQSEHFEAEYDGLRSKLKMFFLFNLRMPNPVTQLNLVIVHFRLRLYNPSLLLSEINVPFGMSVDQQEWKQGLWAEFSLDKDAVRSIEKSRTGDVKFSIEIEGLFSYSGGSYPNGSYSMERAHAFTVIIPKSVWIEEFLPKLGHDTFKLIEIPFTHKLLKEAYNDILEEFTHAEEYYIKNDYNKCVAHCRHTLDALHRNLIKIKKSEKSESGFSWLSNTSEETFKWIDEMDKSISFVTAKTHHSGLKREFKRYEAESIYFVTIGLLHYVANISGAES
jgi:hypothetical protein